MIRDIIEKQQFDVIGDATIITSGTAQTVRFMAEEVSPFIAMWSNLIDTESFDDREVEHRRARVTLNVEWIDEDQND